MTGSEANSLAHNNQHGETIPLGEILLKTADVLSDNARICTEMQWLISSLLERAHHPDLPAELHMLQDIDRLHQNLVDVASLIAAISHPVKGLDLEAAELSDSLKLDSLRARLFGQSREPVSQNSADGENAGITWL